MATVVSIGRDVNGHALNPTQWALFKSETRQAVELLTPLVFVGEGEGIWEDQREVAYTVIGAATLSGANADLLRYRLEALARNYEQDAIALTLGETEFV